MLLGIDVSSHNGTLDWAAIKSAGVSFAILRAGYGRYQVDSQFYRNVQGASAQGIPVGVYWFSYALDESGAKAEAQKCLETLRDCDIALPVFFDFEYDTVRYAKDQGIALGRAAFNAHASAFCEVIRAAGHTPGVYYNLDYYRSMVDPAVLGSYVQWYAQYASSPSIGGWDLWQYTGSGTLAGVSGKFDCNYLKNEALLDLPSDWVWQEGQWFYRKGGLMLTGQWILDSGSSYYLSTDGTMVANRAVKIGADGRLVPAGAWYETLRQVPQEYRPHLDSLIARGILKGRSGSGEDLVLDLSEEAVRLLVVWNRSGAPGS